MATKTTKKQTPKKTVRAPRTAKTTTKSTIADPQPINFIHAIRGFFNNYFNFSGRATRAEYWWAQLFVIASIWIGLIVSSLFTTLGLAPIALILLWVTALWGLALIIPNLSLMARRVHDAGFSAWVFFIPFIIAVVLQYIPGVLGSIGNTFGILVSIWGLVLALLPSKK